MINASFVISLNSAFILSVFGWRSNRHNTHYLLYLDVIKPKWLATLWTLKLLLPYLTAPDILLQTSTTLASIYPLTNCISHNINLRYHLQGHYRFYPIALNGQTFASRAGLEPTHSIYYDGLLTNWANETLCLFNRYKVLIHPTLAKLGYVVQEALPSIISQSYNI